MLYIRADANNIIATGHLMRCCSIAEAVKKGGDDIVFVTADEYGQEIAEEKGFSCIKLNSRWDDLNFELNQMQELIDKNHITQLLIDSYYVTKKYLQILDQKTCVTYIDDLHEMVYPCSRLINYSIYASKFPYKKEYNDTELLLGCGYAPLRKAFQNLSSKKIKQKIDNVLVLSGGADSIHFIYRFLIYIINKKKLENIKFEIVCGKYNGDYLKIKEAARTYRNICIHKNLDNLEFYMQKADLAVSAGGSTLYELCACGTPTICYALADNQLENVHGFHQKGVMYYCGDVRKGDDFFYRFYEKINYLIENPLKRAEISASMQGLVDGQGANCIAHKLKD